MERNSQFAPSVITHVSSRIPVVGERVAIPRPEDVVATKVRSWHAHEGNIFYRDLVDKAYRNIERSDIEGTRRAAERIVNIITLDRKGVFLREALDGWVVMDHRAAVNKVVHAIKNCQDKDAAGSWAGIQKIKQKRSTFKKKPPKARMSGPAKRRSSSPNEIVYQAQSGATTTIHRYALQVISAACNRSTPQEALLFLESPMPQYRNGNEPSRERMMRLQLRHRYVAALSSGLMPIEFSRKLLDLWGGTLEQINLGLAEEPKETTAIVPSALHADETTVDDAMPNMDTAPVVNGAARIKEEGRSDVIGESTVDIWKVSDELDVIVLAASM